MRRLFWLLALVVCTWVVMQREANGQPSSDIARHIGWGTTLPTHCKPSTADIFTVTGPPAIPYYCKTTDVWEVFGTGAGVSGLTPGAVTKALTSTSLTDAIAGVDYALPGSPPTPGYQPNQTLSGCGVEYVSALVFNVGACTYTIAGVTYTIPTTTVETLSAGDASFPRIDLIGVDTSGAVFVTQGTPAASPAAPAPDASTQLGLTIVTVAALATTPTGVTVTSIYEENTEWTSAVTAHFNAASTSNPYRGSKDIEATAAVLTNSVTLTKPAAGTEVLTNYNSFVFYISSKAAWPTGTGASAARNLAIFWLSGSTQVGSQVILRDGTFGFSSSNTSTYQQIIIPTALFGTGGSSVTSVRFQIAGNGGSTSIGSYLDAISLQGGVGPSTLPATLMNFKGAWSSTATYSPNDTVTSGGVGYVALATNTNIAVTVTATWRALSGGAAGSTTQMQRNVSGLLGGVTGATSDGTNLFVTTQAASDNSTKSASTAYADTAVANAIAGVNPAVAVLAASTANVTGTYANGVAGVGATFTVTATGAFTLDGISISTIGQRVLFKDQTTGFQNGVYTATVVGIVAVSPVFTRALDYNSPSDINSTGAIPVQSGTVNATTSWLLTSTVTTVGTDTLTYVQFSIAPSTLAARVCSMLVGSDNASAVLVDADIGPQGQQCKIPKASTVVEIDVNADAGTPSVIVRKKHCASFTAGVCTSWTSTDFLSSALSAAASNFDACSKTTAVAGLDGGTTCSATLQNTSIAAGDWIELKSGTAGGTAKRFSIDVIYTVN